jgi:hypothetical protein
MAERALRIETITDPLFQALGIRESSVGLPFPDPLSVIGGLETPPAAGKRATSPSSAPNVSSSSCAIQAARSSQWHWVQ